MVHAMYQCLVNYTGAVPAEFYSVKKRPVGGMDCWLYGCYIGMTSGWINGWMEQDSIKLCETQIEGI